MADQPLTPFPHTVLAAESPPVDLLTLAHIREHIERPAGIRGGFRLSLASGRWWWSPGVFELHGFGRTGADGLVPSTRLLLAHRLAADRPAFDQAWRHLMTDGWATAFRYRIVGVDGRVRPVFVMASLDGGADRRTGVVTGVMQSDGRADRAGIDRAVPQQTVDPLLDPPRSAW